ncbi:flavin reductase/cob(II)yrinic acid a,c-diamide reductase [Pleomorphomonas diazotrophica]|nr:flavin reductase/cob(II)yrinic acid a,c-diamide reductase [Pleomorphomonas diazotrophica]
MANDSTADRDLARQSGTLADLPPATGEAFRDAIARLPSGVNIVTSAGSAGKAGFTATAVASVSDDPPTVLVCLNRKSPQNKLMRENAQFAVNLLPKDAVTLANIFAGRTGLHLEDRFKHGDWTTLTTGSPVLKGAVMALDCRLLSFEDVGSHTVYFGTVLATLTKPRHPEGAKEVLIYHDRHYGEA